MDVRRWLRERRPTPPATLLARLEEVLARADAGDSPDIVASALNGAEALLREVVAVPQAGRECALDLLTADALATYAFEVASESPDALAEHARRAMVRFASVGATSGAERGC